MIGVSPADALRSPVSVKEIVSPARELLPRPSASTRYFLSNIKIMTVA